MKFFSYMKRACLERPWAVAFYTLVMELGFGSFYLFKRDFEAAFFLMSVMLLPILLGVMVIVAVLIADKEGK